MRSHLLRQLCDKYYCTISYTANYCSRADSVERYNRIIKIMIRSYMKDEHLSLIDCAIRSSRTRRPDILPTLQTSIVSTSNTPTHINKYLLDKDADRPDLPPHVQKRNTGYQQLFEKVKRCLATAQEDNRRVYNLRRRPLQFAVGDQVWRRNKAQSNAAISFTAKLAPAFVGPFIIKQKVGFCTH